MLSSFWKECKAIKKKNRLYFFLHLSKIRQRPLFACFTTDYIVILKNTPRSTEMSQEKSAAIPLPTFHGAHNI